MEFNKIKLISLFILEFATPLFANTEIKIAVLDRLQSQRFSSEKYQEDYFDGLRLANLHGKNLGIIIDYKYFEYGPNELDIIKAAKSVDGWNPDVIIGPRVSSKFLLLKNMFKDILVISPLATSDDISKMPINFHSFSPATEVSAKIMGKFARQKLQNRNIHVIVEIDCKSCIDYAQKLKSSYNKKTTIFKILNTEIEKIDPALLTKDFKKDDLVFLSATSYSAGVLLRKIATFKEGHKYTFLGSDEWGSYKSSYVGKAPLPKNYLAYRITPWSLDIKSADMDLFKHYTKEMPNLDYDAITFTTFVTAKSIIESYIVGKKLRKLKNIKDTILKGFIEKRNKSKSFAKQSNFTVFLQSNSGENFLQMFK
jgi:hypothetical protein